MSNESNSNSDLQFDKAEYEGAESSGEAACFACATPLNDSYFDINGQTACEPCKSGIQSSFQGGSRLGRIGKALGFGIVAAIAGALIYFAVLKITGYEVGLLSILVGFMVGKAVFAGSGSRGGGIYQLLAVGLTYLAIVSTYVPFVLEGLQEMAETEPVAEQAVAVDSQLGSTQDLAGESVGVAPVGEANAEIQAQELSMGEIAIMLAASAALILAMPFLAGMDNIIGLLIIAFGLFQAWSLNRRTAIKITGPFDIKPKSA